MIEIKDDQGVIGDELTKREQQVATTFWTLLHAAVTGILKNGEVTEFLAEIEPTTMLTNKTLVARATEDLNSPNGNIIVEIINAGEDGPAAVYTTAQLPTRDGETGKPTVMILLNANSSQFRQVKEGGFLFFKRNSARLTLNPPAMLQILQEVVVSQVVLEKTPEGTYMTRQEYLA